jgi:hypothetical protein
MPKIVSVRIGLAPIQGVSTRELAAQVGNLTAYRFRARVGDAFAWALTLEQDPAGQPVVRLLVRGHPWTFSWGWGRQLRAALVEVSRLAPEDLEREVAVGQRSGLPTVELLDGPPDPEYWKVEELRQLVATARGQK